MSTVPQYTYQTGKKHLRDVLSQPKFEVRANENKPYRPVHWVTVKSKRLPHTEWKAIPQPFAHDEDNQPYTNYTWMTIEKLVKIFGLNFPPWIADNLTRDDKEFAKAEFEKLVEAADIGDLVLQAMTRHAESTGSSVDRVRSVITAVWLLDPSRVDSMVAETIQYAKNSVPTAEHNPSAPSSESQGL
ncbi:hypothetical protein FFLO_05962 [Filobasidium floriforme]|uniref:Uncharacterized protein n=1 Tax=Filobasidium floriforme TaxID=5210 RepID=A0A8K0JFX1_9TREE|nr:uncharacterized protein HD553DRAFT_353451 [Filobasidium floriforme]KAG7528736.1 hypothetical protein FFLO_05962 [Filobasidium floriforme]KAH8077285.1 hypothetical protein HD553DRAFT_353451 [Filobasidium floriforme]